MAKQKSARKRKKPEKAESGFELKPAGYQPSKAEMEQDISVPVSLERLAKAAVSGGAERRRSDVSA
jgi:hypothetical protein